MSVLKTKTEAHSVNTMIDQLCNLYVLLYSNFASSLIAQSVNSCSRDSPKVKSHEY